MVFCFWVSVKVSRVGAQLDVSQFDSNSKFVVDLHVNSDKHVL